MIKVGFIGLGRMGGPMALRLLEAGAELSVYNRSPAASEPFAARGAAVAGSVAELAAGNDLILTMLSGPAAVEAVIAGEDGILAAARPETVIVEMSTIGPTVARELAARAEEAGMALVDAPVSGSVPAAEAGTLTAFAGGPVWAFERAQPALAAIAAKAVRVGESGSGAAVKLGLNTVLAMLNQGIAEALALAEAEGIEREAMYAALESSAVAAPYVAYKRDAFLGGPEGEVAFDLAGLGKDVDLALRHGRAHDLPMFGAAAVGQVLTAAAGLGLGGADIAAVGTVIDRMRSSSES